MSIRVGDAVFIRSGIPATVKDRSPATGQLVLETDYAQVQKDMRHGYLNGLSPDSRNELYSILDTVKASSEEPRARVDAIRSKLDELEADPTKLALASYLRSEMLHIMNAHEIKPREYTASEIKAR